MIWPYGAARDESESIAGRIQVVRSAGSGTASTAGQIRREIPLPGAARPRDRTPRIRYDEDAMSHKTKQYRPSKSQRFLRPAFGLAAAFAAVATLGLTVATPAALATAESSDRFARESHEAQHASPSPAEVAILPARIDVVVVRAKSVVSAGQLGPVDGRQRS